MANESLKPLIEELTRRMPEMADVAEATAESYVENLGSVDDALLYLEWLDRSKEADEQTREALMDEIGNRAKSRRLLDIIRSIQPDILFN